MSGQNIRDALGGKGVKANMKPIWNQYETNMKPMMKPIWNQLWNQYETDMKPIWNQYETNMKPICIHWDTFISTLRQLQTTHIDGIKQLLEQTLRAPFY